jgi:glycosyltransferase involved in cell wall biosynthesis
MPSGEPAAAAAAVPRPLRVAFLLQDFTTGGISQWIYTVCRELHRTHPGAFDFHFIATHGWVIRDYFHRVGTPVFLGREGHAPNWLVWRRVRRYLARLRPHVVQFSNLRAYRDLVVALRPPVVVDRKAGMRTLDRYSLRGVDVVISQNQQVVDALADRFDPARTFLVYPGVDIEALRAVVPDRLGFSDDDVIVGQLSRLGRGQGHGLLIDAVLSVRKRHPNVRLVLVGGTTPQAGAVDLLPELRARAAPLGDSVRFTGDVSEPFALMAGFDIATVTSTREVSEGIPRKLVEPMARGIPCVTTDSGACPEAVDDEVNGFVVEDGNVAQMADRIERLVTDRALYAKFSAAAREKVERVFDIRVEAQKVRTIYLDAYARRKAAPVWRRWLWTSA